MQFAKFREQVAGLWLIFLRMTAKPSQQINRQSDQQGKDRTPYQGPGDVSPVDHRMSPPPCRPGARRVAIGLRSPRRLSANDPLCTCPAWESRICRLRKLLIAKIVRQAAKGPHISYPPPPKSPPQANRAANPIG